MKLQTRITLGYGYFIVLVIASIASAAYSFQQLGQTIGQILEENFKSVQASMHMLEALERQDSAMLGVLLRDVSSVERLRLSEQAFEAALKEAVGNITISEESEVVTDIRRSFQDYRTSRDGLLGESPEHPLEAYRKETFPRFEIVKGNVLHLLDLNHRAMIAADRTAQRSAIHHAISLGLLMTLTVLSAAFLNRGLKRDLLLRLRGLQFLADGIDRGRLDQRAPVRGQDELDQLARAMNRLLDRQQEVEGHARAHLVAHRQVLLGLLQAQAERALVTTVSGDVVASTFEEEETNQLAGRIQQMDEASRGKRAEQRLEIPALQSAYRVQPLWVNDQRPVGWLIQHEDSDTRDATL